MERTTRFNTAKLATLLATTLALLVSLPALANNIDRMNDDDIRGLIEHRLAKKDLDVDVAVSDGNVTLTGQVATLREMNQAIRIAENSDDVTLVQSRLEVDSDDSLQDVAAGVSKALRNYAFFDIFDWVEARIDGRTVTLDGSVHQGWRRDAIQRRIENVPGVNSVVNRVELQRPSAFDDNIRYQVANAIYGDLTFLGRGDQINPPIHIIVDGGKLTLEGVVRNRAEQALARSLASSAALSIGPIQNNLEVASDIER